MSFSIVMILSLLGVVLLVVSRAVAKVCRFLIVTDWISTSITFDDSPSIDGRLADAFHERLMLCGVEGYCARTAMSFTWAMLDAETVESSVI